MSLYVLPTISYLTLTTRVEFDAAAKLSENCNIAIALRTKWACGAAGSALPWHGRGRRFDPDQVHQTSQQLRPGERLGRGQDRSCSRMSSFSVFDVTTAIL